jgi:hypothetical protein
MKTKKMMRNTMISKKKNNKPTNSLISTNERKILTRRKEKRNL